MTSLKDQFKISSFDTEIINDTIDKFLNSEFVKRYKDKIPELNSGSTEDHVACLQTAYQREKLVLAIGAGVSIGYGLPSWTDLLQKLMVTTIEEEQQTSTVLARMFNTIFKPDPIIAGRYLQEYFSSKKISFEDAVRKSLYKSCNYDAASSLMTEIVNYCVAAGKSPNLDSIISYNFDDILEYKLKSMEVDIPFKPIYHVGMTVDNDELPIYHVHGYLPQKGKLTERNSITFGESVYHQQYNDTYSWNNITQINKFRDNTCLFIGSSLTDPNMRRLLDIAQQQRGQNRQGYHYMFRKKYDVNDIESRLQELLQSNRSLMNSKAEASMGLNETVEILTDIIEKFEENDSLSFGVKTIWVEDYSDIPSVLEKIRGIKGNT